MNGRTVILVDDGIAMGVTLVPVIALCQKNGASNVMDTADMQAAPADTTVMRVNTISQDPGLVTH